ncbi:MAG: hypothetical protein NC388_06055 [Clostridium sp.]|nr:hypothetical protein [Clostridium sp.]
MDDLDKEWLQGAEDDIRTVAFIKNHLPQEKKEIFSDDDLLYIMDILADYYTEKGVWEQEGDENGEIEIDLEEAVAYILKTIQKDGVTDKFTAEDLLWVVEAELEYGYNQEE